ncbi:MAG: hypothetical protein JSV92_01440 [archaeon]|nr:MAG: hypothetical protein JSV92_01440 [archaeon]
MNDFILVDPNQIRIVNLLYEKGRPIKWSELAGNGIDKLYSHLCSLVDAEYVDRGKDGYYLTDKGKKYMDGIEELSCRKRI